MIYLTVEQVLFIHDRLIIETGGSHGVRDLGLLESAVYRPQSIFDGADLYPDLFTIAASLLQSLIQNHPFIDGNKRTGITSTILFLNLNGCQIKLCNNELEQFTIDGATQHPTIVWIASWLINHQ